MNLIKVTESGLMKFADLDAVAGNVLAEMLDIEHAKMMRTIKRVMKSEKNRKEDTPEVASHNLLFRAIFKEWEYTSKQNKKLKTYILNEDALYLVVANSQSAKAHELKVWFKSEFNKMRIERGEREISKALHKPFTDQVQHLYLALKKEGSGLRHEAMLHTNFAVKIRKAMAGKKVNRDELTAEQNLMVSEIEDNVAMQLQFCFDNGWTAREARTNAYAFIAGFAS